MAIVCRLHYERDKSWIRKERILLLNDPTLILFQSSESGSQRQNCNRSRECCCCVNLSRTSLPLLSCSIPGVFPESPRWLLLSERSADMSSFSERRNSSRDVGDDESFTGVCERMLSIDSQSWTAEQTDDWLEMMMLCLLLPFDSNLLLNNYEKAVQVFIELFVFCRAGFGAGPLLSSPSVLP